MDDGAVLMCTATFTGRSILSKGELPRDCYCYGRGTQLTTPDCRRAVLSRRAMRRSYGCTRYTSRVSFRVRTLMRSRRRLTFAATEGDITVARPGMLDMLGRSKWSVIPRYPSSSADEIGTRGTSKKANGRTRPSKNTSRPCSRLVL